LTIGVALAALGEWNEIVIWMGALFGFLACGILHDNNLQDIPVDSARGATTLASLVGFRWSQHILAGFYLAAVGSAVVIGIQLGRWLGFFVLPIVFILPVFWKLVSKTYDASGPFAPTLHGLRFETAKAHLATAVLFSVGQLVAIFLLK
ncbi:MAG: UbiA family prenyltransferase, partial [Bdellovibrionales bacterium]|nr:UbiA family prenyltransferase [Bdellovibrionales bacterium]